MRVTCFSVENSRGYKIDADPFGNNIAFACFSCKHPVLAIARERHRGNSKEKPAICMRCEARYFIQHIDRESEKVVIASIQSVGCVADESANAMNQSEIRGDFPYWGIDSCKGGWLCVGLNRKGEHCAFVAENIRCAYQMMQEQKAKIALIDIPIGLSDDAEERKCDKHARQFVGERHSSVFRVPCRQAMDAYKEGADHETGKKAGEKESRRIAGGPMSEQTWSIAPKIAEVDDFLQSPAYVNNEKFMLRETHPEVCFRALSPRDADLEYSKSEPAGQEERRKILASHLPDAKKIESEIKRCLKSGVDDDDILDAMVAAVTAKIGFRRFDTLPPNPPKDSRGLPMEMVFSKGQS